MWLYFNSNGQLTTILEHGSPARVGSTNFSVFAVFEDITDAISLSSYSATIKLKKPDFTGSSYPTMLMTPASSIFSKLTSETDTGDFDNGSTYYGFLFDFNELVDIGDDTHLVVLDTNGLWKAVVTLISEAFFVQGVATFDVGGSGSEEETSISYDVVTNQLVSEINKKAAKDQVIIVIDSSSSDVSTYENGQFFYSALERVIYQKVNGVLVLVGGFDIAIDSALSTTSEYPVQNKVVTAALNNKVDKTSSLRKVYATDSSGEQTTLPYDWGIAPSLLVQRYNDGHITVPVTPTNNSYAASKKYVDDADQNLREVAEGKCNSFVMSDKITRIADGGIYYLNSSNVETFMAASSIGSFNVYNSTTKEWENKKTELGNGDFNGLRIVNRNFDTQDSKITIDWFYQVPSYIIFNEAGSAGGGSFYLLYVGINPISSFNAISVFPIKNGDVFLVIEIDVPDRWCHPDGITTTEFYKLETSKVPLENYAAKAGTNNFSGENCFTGAYMPSGFLSPTSPLDTVVGLAISKLGFCINGTNNNNTAIVKYALPKYTGTGETEITLASADECGTKLYKHELTRPGQLGSVTVICTRSTAFTLLSDTDQGIDIRDAVSIKYFILRSGDPAINGIVTHTSTSSSGTQFDYVYYDTFNLEAKGGSDIFDAVNDNMDEL